MERKRNSLFKLAIWWWNLTPQQRAKKREEFMHRFETDPVFHDEVKRLLEKDSR